MMLQRIAIIGILVIGSIGCSAEMQHHKKMDNGSANHKMRNKSNSANSLVKYEGAMREMFSGGGIKGRVDFGKLDQNNLFAIAPLENLSGEITVFNGESLVSTIEDEKVTTKINSDVKAPFAVWANVKDWQETSIPANIKSNSQLEDFISQTIKEKGLDADEALPFLIEGTLEKADWHINNYIDDGEKLTKEKHDKMKYRRTSNNEEFQLLGFYSTKHQGIFTHHDRKTHIHLRTLDNKITSHLDDFTLGGKNILKLPQISDKSAVEK